ncbi:TPA: ATP-binding protein, partial [Salmonella enterica subsp. enterica serovar Typhimurium var. 5-]|nr:ATP-binding protein [Salmonella enterica subsp. enterica serovar Typhimurium var. 5-]
MSELNKNNQTIPFDLIRPKVPVGCHPIEQGDYILDTIAINELSEQIIKWVKMRYPGAIVYGPPRLGKTFATRYLKKLYEMKYSNEWFTCLISSRKIKTSNEDRFFKFMLKDLNDEFYENGKADAKRERIFNLLLDKGQQTKRNQIVLFYDDAQRLGEDEYEWLMDIYNELQSKGITLTTILVGQQELAHRRNTYITTKKQIVGRFMIHEQEFHGIRDVEELEFLMAGYDSVSEYPKKSGWSYTRFFFPDSFDEGMRLENVANVLWNNFEIIRAEYGLKKNQELPMHYVIAIINFVLLQYGANGENVKWPTSQIWREGIIECGYVAAELIHESIGK